MTKKTYSEKLLDPRWQKKRLQILNRDNFTCRICSDTKSTLHIHHEKYAGEPWDVEDEFLKTTCSACHEIIEYCKDMEYSVLYVEKKGAPICDFAHAFVRFKGGLAVIIFERKNTKYEMIISIHQMAIERFYSILNSL